MSRALTASKVSSISIMTTNPEVSRLYAAWRRLGVNFSVASCPDMVEVEPLILATAAVAGADERLTICAISWLARYHSFVDGRRLSELTRDSIPSVRSYLGIMFSLAIEAPDGAAGPLLCDGAHPGAGSTRGGIVIDADCRRTRGPKRTSECSGVGSGYALNNARSVVSTGGC